MIFNSLHELGWKKSECHSESIILYFEPEVQINLDPTYPYSFLSDVLQVPILTQLTCMHN